MQQPEQVTAAERDTVDGAARPSAGSTSHSNAALLGEVAWLMLGSNARLGWGVADFARLVMPALALRQFRLYYDGTMPIAFVSWALLSPDAEARFIADPMALRPEDWRSGEAAYIVDVVARKGAMQKISRLLRRDPLISQRAISGARRRNGVRRTIRISGDHGGMPRITVERADRL